MYLKIKRGIDIVLSVIGIIILMPVFIIIAIAIKIDSKGPVFFLHKRIGKNGKNIKIYKFRTMCENAEDMIKEFNTQQLKEYKEKYKLTNDPRITKMGKFLRKTNLDELPQILNILKGELSIVGPRPIVEEELEKYEDNKSKFLSVTPGLTGYWKANEQKDTTYEQRMEMELYYVDNISFLLDMEIFFKTFLTVFKSCINYGEQSRRIAKNITKISLGTLLGQAISIITVPIYTRIYGAEIIGTWAFFNAIYLFITSFSALGLTFSIMTEKEEEKRIKIYTTVTTIGMIISTIIAIIIGITYSTIKVNNTGLNMIFLVIYSAITIFTMQQIHLCYTWLNKKEKYNILMKNSVICNITFAIIGISLGMLGLKQYGYFIGFLAGQVVTVIHMKRHLPHKLFNFKWLAYKEVFQENIPFLKYQLPGNIINELKNQLPTFFIEGFFGNTILGYYSVATKILNIPVNLIGNSIGKVFFQETSKMVEQKKSISEFYYKNMKLIMKLGVIPMIFLITFGKPLAVLFLGQEWAMVGNIVSIVSLQGYFTFLTASVQGISIHIKKQNYDKNMYIVQAITTVLAFYIGFSIFHNIYLCLIIMSVLYAISNIIYFYYIVKEMKISTKRYLTDVIYYVGIVFIVAFILNRIVDKLF